MGLYRNQPPGFAVGEVLAGWDAGLNERSALSLGVALHHQAAAWGLELDRLTVRSDLRPALQIAVGKFYTPITWWAVNVPRGGLNYAPLRAPTLATPEWRLGPLPSHLLGADVWGLLPLGAWQIGYGATAGNGRSPVVGSALDDGDADFQKALAARVWLASPGGLSLGGAVYRDVFSPLDDPLGWGDLLSGQTALARAQPAPEIRPLHLEEAVESTIEATTREQIVSAHAAWRGDRLEAVVEGILVRHATESVDPVANYSGYLHVAWSEGPWTPYAQLSHTEMRYGDPLYVYLQTYTSDRAALGIRRDLNARLALKGELSFDSEDHYDAYGIVDPDEHLDLELQLAAGL